VKAGGTKVTKISPKGLLAIALVLSLVTSLLVYNYLKGVTSQTAKQTQTVMVAKVDIPPKTKITADMVQEVKVPAEYIQPGAILELGGVVGVVARETIVAGEQITERRLVIAGKPVGFSGMIPWGKRAVTVAVTEVTGVAGMIKAGDWVDVVATFDKQDVGSHTSQVVLQNIQVLAVNRETEAGSTTTGKDGKEAAVKTATVTLAVSPDEAAQLALGEEKGKIRMALRPFLANEGVVAATAETPQDMVGMHPHAMSDNSGSTAKSAPSSPPSNPSVTPPPTSQPSMGAGIQMIRGTKITLN
jgi:pilus assembly protein CpaB